MTHLHALNRLDAIERRYSFAAWPQRYAHASWFELLDEAVGLNVCRDCGRAMGVAERAVGQALLGQVGASFFERVPVDKVPLWAMQAHGTMRRHLSVVAALSVLPVLRLAVCGAEARQWDAVLGPDVRQTALSLWRTNPQVEPPSQAMALRKSAKAAAKSAAEWDRFCLSLGLTALAKYNSPALHARVRLAWPCGLREVEPLAGIGIQPWLDDACQHVTQCLRIDRPLSELAT